MKDFLRLDVEKVVAGWATLKPTAEELEAVLELAYLAIASDHVVTRTEVEAFAIVMERLFGPELTAKRIAGVLEQYEDALDRSGLKKRLKKVAGQLRRPVVRDRAYQLAYAMVMCDLDTNIDEFEFDNALRAQLGLTEEAAEALVDGVIDLVIAKAPARKGSAKR
jgi:hypothetical protein